MKFYALLIIITLNSTLFSYVQANGFSKQTRVQTSNLVKAGNKYVTLLGTQIAVGELAPNFKVVDASFVPVTLEAYSDKTLLISVVPSLDTGVCSLQTKRFNQEIGKLPANVAMITISNDLPFAQKRFCKTEHVDKIKVLSDSVWRDFGYKYGLLIKDMGLLTRAIFIIDASGKIAYKELVSDLSNHPDYEMALAQLKALTTEPIEPTKSTKSTKPDDKSADKPAETPAATKKTPDVQPKSTDVAPPQAKTNN